jgi:hypothetical protein
MIAKVADNGVRKSPARFAREEKSLREAAMQSPRFSGCAFFERKQVARKR